MNNYKFACLLLEARYVELIKNKYKDIKDSDILPIYWYNSDYYEEKIKILNKAIKQQKLVSEINEIVNIENGMTFKGGKL